MISALAAAFALLISPIGLIIVGPRGLAAGAVYVWQNWETIVPKLSALWDSIASAFSAAWGSIKSGQALDAAISWVKTKVQELVPAILEALPG